MKILALDCSAGPASVAIVEEGKVISSAFVNIKLTHSETLMPMVENVLRQALLDFSDIGLIAINNGPGSFTGVRIGIALAKGLAEPKKLPTLPVSTLLSMAYNLCDTDCIACAVMDARCNQVYNALFDISGGVVTRLTEDRALKCDELAENLKTLSQKEGKRVIIVGDGANVFWPFAENIQNACLSSEKDRYQNAVSVGLAATEILKNENPISSEELLPLYLRLPQAERELKEKTK